MLKMTEPNVILKGTVVRPGMAEGIVRIIEDDGDTERVNKGDIVVIPSSIPIFKYIHVMIFARAILTEVYSEDLGQVTGDLHIPYVWSEKATEVLEDGVYVTVDAYKGCIFSGMIIGVSNSKNSFTISLADYAANQGRKPSDYEISTIEVSSFTREDAIKYYNVETRNLDAVVAIIEGSDDTSTYFIRGTGVKLKSTED